MKQYELLELKKLYLSKNKFTRNTKLKKNQRIIIISILFFMLIFISYKITYFIFIQKENIKNKFSFISYNLLNENKENITYNIQFINNITTTQNKTLFINDNLLIPISYSNHLEDLILNYFFHNVNLGFYIDIGNFSPNEKSTTKHFYLKGWTGINIKPLNEEYNELINKRPKDININYYLGGKFKTKFYFQEFNETNNTYHQISDILNDYIPKNRMINFCKIDMKKDVRKVLLGYDFENYRPKIFCIENNSNKSAIFDSFEYILNKNDYKFVYQYEIDRYYIDNKEKNLKEQVDYIDDIIQAYKNKIKQESNECNSCQN